MKYEIPDCKVVYDGRVVSEKGFRAFVYGPNNAKKLANSWGEYQNLTSSGIWFSKKSQVPKEVAKDSDKDSKKGK